jgi:hypothetical protein
MCVYRPAADYMLPLSCTTLEDLDANCVKFCQNNKVALIILSWLRR